MKAVAVARLASYFLLLVQKKVTKQKDTPYRLFPALLSLLGGKLKLASLKQSLADNSHQACAAWRGSRGVKVIILKVRVFYGFRKSLFFVIPVKTGIQISVLNQNGFPFSRE